MIDIHAFWNAEESGIDGLMALARSQGVNRVVFSPPAVTGMTRKPASLYRIQRVMLRSSWLAPVARRAAASFYDANGDLRRGWRRLGLGGSAYQKVLHPDNAGLAKAFSLSASGMARWQWFHPEYGAADNGGAEGAWRVDGPSVVGIKIHPYWHGISPDRLRHIMDLARSHRLPVYVHLGYGGLGWILETFRDYPAVSIILACGGYPYFDHLWVQIRRMEHVCIDLASDHIDLTGIRSAAKILGDRRCIFATDAPDGLSGADVASAYSERVATMRAAFPDPKSRERVSLTNALERIPRLNDAALSIRQSS